MTDFRLVLVPTSGSFATLVRLREHLRSLDRFDLSNWRQVSDSHQIVSCSSELKDPTHQPKAAMTCFTQQPHGLQPAKDLFHSFALSLADCIARMTSRALVNCTTAAPFVVLRDMRRHAALPQLSHEALRVIGFVGRQGHALFRLAQQPERRLAFRRAAGLVNWALTT